MNAKQNGDNWKEVGLAEFSDCRGIKFNKEKKKVAPAQRFLS